MITLIAAMSKNRVIGGKSGIPWRIPKDMAFFSKVTKFCPVVMGQRTFESIGKTLRGRENIILSMNNDYKCGECLVYNDIQKLMTDFKNKNLMVIGGGEIYRQFLPYADKICLTYIDQEFEGDTFFPEFDLGEWKLVSKEKGLKDKNNPYDYYFRWYNKVR